MLFILKSLSNGQNREFLKNCNWNMRKTPSKMHMNDMVPIDTTVFEIVGVGGGVPLSGSLTISNTTDRIG